MASLRFVGVVGSVFVLAACASPAPAQEGAGDSAAAESAPAEGPACSLEQDGSVHHCAADEFCDDDLVGICLPDAQKGPRCGLMPSGETPKFCLADEYCADELTAKCAPESWRGAACGLQPSGQPKYCEVGVACYEGAVCVAE